MSMDKYEKEAFVNFVDSAEKEFKQLKNAEYFDVSIEFTKGIKDKLGRLSKFTMCCIKVKDLKKVLKALRTVGK